MGSCRQWGPEHPIHSLLGAPLPRSQVKSILSPCIWPGEGLAGWLPGVERRTTCSFKGQKELGTCVKSSPDNTDSGGSRITFPFHFLIPGL